MKADHLLHATPDYDGSVSWRLECVYNGTFKHSSWDEDHTPGPCRCIRDGNDCEPCRDGDHGECAWYGMYIDEVGWICQCIEDPSVCWVAEWFDAVRAECIGSGPWGENGPWPCRAVYDGGMLLVPADEHHEVMAVRKVGTNADLIADAFRLGYLADDMRILDATYGLGVFWKRHRPPMLITNDIDPKRRADHTADFTDLPCASGRFDAVVFDPDYKLQGTSSNAGPATSNNRYGMDRDYRSIADQYGIIGRGLAECVRVTRPGGTVLVKYMSQVVSGSVHWMEIDIPMMMGALGCDYVDDLRLLGYRQQPLKNPDGSPRRQVHARRNYSVLGIFEVAK